MNRKAYIAAAFALSLSSSLALAADSSVTEIEQKIGQKQSEYDNYNKSLESEIAVAASLEKDLETLRDNSALADADRQSTLVEMNLQYELMIENPDLDISKTREAYARAVSTHKRIKDAITSKYNQWQTKLQDLDQARLSKHSLLNTLESLKEQLNTARIDRLYKEFNTSDRVQISHAVVCDREETIAKCSDRGKALAKQKASKRFLDQLYDGLSESVEAARRRPYSDAYVQVLRSDVVDSNFSGQGNFNVKLNVELQGNLKRKEVCELLGLDNRYCVATASDKTVEPVTVAALTNGMPTDESVMYELTVRSNVFDDEVFIDGVSYGSTKLQIMLPSGQHDVEVVKRGYEAYRQRVNLNASTTLKAELPRARYSFNKGEKIQDFLTGDISGPALVVVPAGSFQMGDISGTGLENERPAEPKDLSDSFGISETEITVADFKLFVEATSYVTEAEKNKGCAAYDGDQPEWNEKRNWRAPGFTQNESHPAVCVSLVDAQAYVDWLSESSAQSYRLPSEVEWEYTARAGKTSNYWWGEDIGTDNANCGWCGSQWSNASSAPVASFARNGFGLFDTVGNVWEWASSSKAASAAVVRGGAWNFAPRLARVSTRMELDPAFRANYIGFRVVRDQ